MLASHGKADPGWRKVINRNDKKKVYVVDGAGSISELYTTWSSLIDFQCVVVNPELEVDWTPPKNCGLVVAHDQFRNSISAILMRIMRENGVPVLILADGILEYRNTWYNPRIASGSMYQPVLGHKMACIGPSQARVIESWGNFGKCENIGFPRLDLMAARSPRSRTSGKVFRLLIVTARTPGFTERQLAIARDSLKCVKQSIEEFNRTHDLEILPSWRVAPDIVRVLGISNSDDWVTSEPLESVLQSVDAMISTPSTCLLEGMLQGIPVAVLNFWNVPQYVPTAWSVSCCDAMLSTLEELVDPPPDKMFHQEFCLADSLRGDGRATERLLQLMGGMIEIGEKCRANGQPLELPYKMIAEWQLPIDVAEMKLDLSKLYKDRGYYVLDNNADGLELDHARIEVNRLRNENSQLKTALQLAQKEPNQTWQTFSYRLGRALTWPVRAIRGLWNHW